MSEIFLKTAVDRAIRAVPPLWPLASSVAVNPFLGQGEESFTQAGARLARVAGVSLTMPRAWYAQKIAFGEIIDADLQAAIDHAPDDLIDIAALNAATQRDVPKPSPLPTIADLAAAVAGIDFPALIVERFGAWAAGYFDEGQALWAAPRGHSAYAAWRAVATHDLTPEIAGLSGFAQHVFDAPETAERAIERVIARLDMPEPALETYFHALLMRLGGFAQYARYQLWQAELRGQQDGTLVDLLAIRLIWEEALFVLYRDLLMERWQDVCKAHASPLVVDREGVIDALLQEAAERATQRVLAQSLKARPAVQTPVLQAIFCIDVRSEVFRRALEAQSPDIQTLGFAGFFGLNTAHRRFASDVEEQRLPVLLTPALHSHAGEGDDGSVRVTARAKRAWQRFKLAAVSSFAFVEASGPVYIAKLLADALRLPKSPKLEPQPCLSPQPDLEKRIKMAEAVLRAMSLTSGFARWVVFVGHGAQLVNNPHASALQCGACGGYAGDVNARLLAILLNDLQVRAGLRSCGIDVPDDTLFLAALHDTVTDQVVLYGEDQPYIKAWFSEAGLAARRERVVRLPRATQARDVFVRGRDWAETRPEWGLAGCSAFIAAPREYTAGGSLAGRVFLHDYAWRQDQGFSILELILTAPVVVASWISLQYYGSTVAPEVFGSGNKLLHNVAGGMGVVEGNGGLLRSGLPWQSVHDGVSYRHEPLRLSVYVEAPREAIDAILGRHNPVRALFDCGWLHLFILEEGRVAWRYREGDWLRES